MKSKFKLYKASWVITICAFCWVYASSNDEFIARQAEQCFGKPVMLQCDVGESVRVLDAFYRQREHCPGHVISNYCTKLETSNPVCVGNRTCTFNAPWVHISTECGFSNNFLVTYQCIPAKLMNNVCGSRAVFRAKRGFLVSPGYPGRYPAPSHCTVRIIASPGETITIHIVDIHLAYYNYDVTHECIDRVWFEETGLEEKKQQGGKGEPLCTRQQRNIVFESQGAEVTVHFTSADHVFSNIRGFWLYYKMGAASSSSTTAAAISVSQSSSRQSINARLLLEVQTEAALSSTAVITTTSEDNKWQTNTVDALTVEKQTLDNDSKTSSSGSGPPTLSYQAATSTVTIATTPTPGPGIDVDRLKSLYRLIGHYYPAMVTSVAMPKTLEVLPVSTQKTTMSSEHTYYQTVSSVRPTSHNDLHIDSRVAITALLQTSSSPGQEQGQSLLADKQPSLPVVAITVGGCISLIVLVVIVCAILFYNRRCFAGSDKVAHKSSQGQRDVILAFDGDKSDSRQTTVKRQEDDRKLTDRNNALTYSVRLSSSTPSLAAGRLTDAAAVMQKATGANTMCAPNSNNGLTAAFSNYSLRAIDEAAEDVYMSAKRRAAPQGTSDYFSSSTRRSTSMKNNTFRSQRATKSMPRPSHQQGHGGSAGGSLAAARSNSLRLSGGHAHKQHVTNKSSTASATNNRALTYQTSMSDNAAFVSATSSDSCQSSNEETAALKKTRTSSRDRDFSPTALGHRRNTSLNKAGGGGGKVGSGWGNESVNYADVRKSGGVRSSVKFVQPTSSHQLLHYDQQQHNQNPIASSANLSPTSSNDDSYESLFQDNCELTTCHERL